MITTPPASPPRRSNDLTPENIDRLEIRTVGIDVGSATVHLMFARVRLERLAQRLSSRFEVVERQVLWASPVTFTRYVDDGTTIDAASIYHFVRQCHEDAGIEPASVDTGAVLLTGNALARHNARAIAQHLAADSGRFVCAAAGHHLEAALAAHGSGATALSRETGIPVVNLDIGGGTAKLALAVDGQVRTTAALAAGSRLVTWDGEGRLYRIEPAALAAAAAAGVHLEPGGRLAEVEASALCGVLAEAVIRQLRGQAPRPLDAALLVTEPFPAPPEPFLLTCSGGVSEYLDPQDVALPSAASDPDLGRTLAGAVHRALSASGLVDRLRPAVQRIRATVIGASQFATQVSGSTVYLGAVSLLPVHDLPVICPDVDLSGSPRPADVAAAMGAALDKRIEEVRHQEAFAVALQWLGPPSYDRLRAVAAGLQTAVADLGSACRLLVITIDDDLAVSLGRIIVTELGMATPPLICLDNITVGPHDYLDVGAPTSSAVVPVVIKSLIFGDPAMPPSRRSPGPNEEELHA